MILRAKDLNMKIMDHSSIKCHKEMTHTWFSSGFIVLVFDRTS